MKHTIAIKFTAIFLTALFLLVAAVGAAGIALMESSGLYRTSLEEHQSHWFDNAGSYISWEYACQYAAEHLGGCSDALLTRLYNDSYQGLDAKYWKVELFLDGRRIAQTPNSIENPIVREYTLSVEYPFASTISPQQLEDPVYAALPNLPDSDYLRVIPQTLWEDEKVMNYYLYYYNGPTYTARVQMHPEITTSGTQSSLANMYPYRYTFIGILLAGLVLFAAGMVFLFWTAGQTRSGTVRPAALNRIPLDVYAGISGIGIWILICSFFELIDWSRYDGFTAAILTTMALNALCIALLFIGFFFALAAQVKVSRDFWWQHCVLRQLLKKLGVGVRFLGRGIRSLYRMLPAVWQWIVTGGVMLLALTVSLALALLPSHIPWPIVRWILFGLAILGCIAAVCYCGYAFGTLLLGAKRMSRGDLEHQVSTRYLFGSFRDFALQINALSDTAIQAARKQMHSERMKTELITNVSHDIKTPLTSIINFVDLLQKPHSVQEQAQYLEVLSRQSGRMKKLIEDLIELSKASSGNMNVNIVTIDAGETVHQALGEFSDKLDRAQLLPVFQQPEEPVMIQADGRLVWRVLSNLLGNAVKYAMPGTRLYIDLVQTRELAVLSLKNVSREAPRASAEELMERFVRGDVSRSTEGSGLGLNIAQSLMEVQGGQLQLTLDGDLFKVTLCFPRSECS